MGTREGRVSVMITRTVKIRVKAGQKIIDKCLCESECCDSKSSDYKSESATEIVE